MFAPTPPATIRRRIRPLERARDLIASVSTTASSKPRAMSARVARSGRSDFCQASRTWVFNPEKLKSSPAVGHWPRERNAPGVAVLGELRQLRTARIRQAHHLGGLVEGLAGGVVEGFAEQA